MNRNVVMIRPPAMNEDGIPADLEPFEIPGLHPTGVPGGSPGASPGAPGIPDVAAAVSRAVEAATTAGTVESRGGEERVREERKRYTTQLQRRAQAHVTAELGADTGAADLDRQVSMLIQHAVETTGSRRVTLFRPVPRGQRWHAATVLDDGCYYYALVAPESLVLPMIAFNQKRAVMLGPDRPRDSATPRPVDLGIRSYLGAPVISSGDVVAVIEAVDVERPEDLERYAASIDQAAAGLAEALAADSRRHGWRPSGAPTQGVSETTILDLVLRPAVEADDTFEVSPQEWLMLNQLNGQRSLADAAAAAGIQLGVATTVVASLLERGLIRVGRENRRRL